MDSQTINHRCFMGIGVKHYLSPLTCVPKAAADVDGLGRAFQDLGYGTLIGHDVGTAVEFRKYLGDFRKHVRPLTQVIVCCFSGHAVAARDGNIHLLLKGATCWTDTKGAHSITVQALRDELLCFPSASSAQILLILNCCRNIPAGDLPISAAEVNGQPSWVRKHMDRAVATIWACASGTTASAGQDDVFADVLCELLMEAEDRSIPELCEHLELAVSSQSRQGSHSLRRQQVCVTYVGPNQCRRGIFSGRAKAVSRAGRLVGLPPQNESFTGRQQELSMVASRFQQQSGECAIVQTRAVTGLGGVGKTQLAKEFAYRHRACYDVIFWVDAERELEANYRRCAAAFLELPSELTPLQVKLKLEQKLKGLMWLLIFDNVERPCDVDPFRLTGSGHILITSRYQCWDRCSTVVLGQLARVDTVVLLHRKIYSEPQPEVAAQAERLRIWHETKKELRGPEPFTEEMVQNCWLLAETVSDFPLALIQASAAIRFFNFTIPEYCDRFRTEYEHLVDVESELMEDGTADCDNYYRSVNATLSIILGGLSRQRHGEGSEKILRAVAMLDAADLPWRLLEPLIKKMFPCSSDLCIRAMVGTLRQCSLLSDVGQDYTVHRVVQHFMVLRMSANERRDCINNAAVVLSELMSRSLFARPEVVETNRRMLPHAHALFAAVDIERCAEDQPQLFGKLLLMIADFYVHEQRDKDMAKYALELANKLQLGAYQEADNSEARLLAGRMEALRAVYWEVLDVNIGNAEKHLRQAEALCRDVELGAELKHMRGNLARRKGSNEEAAKLMEEALAMKAHHPEFFGDAKTAYSQHGLAQVYAAVGKHTMANITFADAIAKKIRFYGTDDHVDVARTQFRYVENILQHSQLPQDRLKGAVMIRSVMKVFKSQLAEDQFEVKSAVNLHDILQSSLGERPLVHWTCSLAQCTLSPFVHPRMLGGPRDRFYTPEQMRPDVRAFTERFAPCPRFRTALEERLGEAFRSQAHQLTSDGLLILPGYLAQQGGAGTLAAWQEWYTDAQDRAGTRQPWLGLDTFTACSHSFTGLSDHVLASAADPYLLALIAHIAGGPVVLSDFRGYTTLPRDSVLFRAWKWHRDGGKEPEWKIMVLLDDVLPGGSEMHFLKGSMRPWKGERQKDANFTMEDALAIASASGAGRPSITRCYGAAGTVVLFAGQGLHRATRSTWAARRAVIMRFKRNVPGFSRIYPLSLADRSRLPPEDSFVSNAFFRTGRAPEHISDEQAKAIARAAQTSRVIRQEQDTTASETDQLLAEYRDMPGLEDEKPRLQSSQRGELCSRVVDIFTVDVHFDLDLPVRQSNVDVSRDLLRVRMRYVDCAFHGAPMRDLTLRCQDWACGGAFHFLTVDELRIVANTLKMYLRIRMREKPGEYLEDINAHARLMMDMGQALTHLDSVQDLRTALCFLYLAHDSVGRMLPEAPGWLEVHLVDLLSSYCCVVMLDDLNASYQQQPLIGWMAKLSPATRQHLCRLPVRQQERPQQTLAREAH